MIDCQGKSELPAQLDLFIGEKVLIIKYFKLLPFIFRNVFSSSWWAQVFVGI